MLDSEKRKGAENVEEGTLAAMLEVAKYGGKLELNSWI
jgi:hypothetical protein